METMKLQSDEINELIAAMAKATLQFDKLTKDNVNPFYKNKYADLATIRKTVSKTLADNGLVVQHFPMGDILVTQLSHTSGQWQRSYYNILNKKGDDQGQGASITYGSRYSLLGIIGIVAEEDDDGNSNISEKPPKKVLKEEVEAYKLARDIKDPEVKTKVFETIRAQSGKKDALEKIIEKIKERINEQSNING